MKPRRSSPFRQPLVWLVFALPAMSVLARMALLYFANGPIDAVADPVRRTAQVQDVDLSRDIEARRLGIAARLRRDGVRIEVEPIGQGFDRAAELELVLRHPVLASLDRRVLLAPSEKGWSVEMAQLDRGNDWLLELAPVDHRWRLSGRWRTTEAEAALRPAVQVAVQ